MVNKIPGKEDNLVSMDDVQTLASKYKIYLDDQTNLSVNTIRKYTNTIDMFLEDFELTIININRFISDHCKEHRSYYMRSAFRHLLILIDQPTLYGELIKPKVLPRKKTRPLVTPSEISEIISRMKDSDFKLIAWIQLETAARASEIIKLKRDQVIKDKGDGVIVRIIQDKTYSERYGYLRDSTGKLLLDRLSRTTTPYIFLDEFKYETYYVYYYNALKKVFKEAGYDTFTTHDIRANAGTKFYRETGDPVATQIFMGHTQFSSTRKYLIGTKISMKKSREILFS